jgi:hypothetical protein
MNVPYDYRKLHKKQCGRPKIPIFWVWHPYQTQLPLHPFFFFDYLCLVGSSNRASFKWLRFDNLAKNDLSLPTTLDQCILIPTATSNPTVLGLVAMPSPRFLGLAWLLDPTCLSLAPTLNPSYLGNISTHSGARTNVLVNC